MRQQLGCIALYKKEESRMITALVGIQTVCVGVTAYLTYRTTKRAMGVKLVEKNKRTGYRHYKAGGF